MQVPPSIRGALLLVALATLAHQAAAHCSYASLNGTYMTQLCSTLPTSDAPACTIYNLCFNTTVDPPLSASVCNTSVLASQLCLDDTAAGVEACQKYIAHINKTEMDANLTLATCWQQLGVDKWYSIPYTSVVRKAAFDNCDAMRQASISMVGCDQCTSNTPAGCPNPFYLLSQGCIDTNMTFCGQGGWKGFCDQTTVTNDTKGVFRAGIGAGVLCLKPDKRVKPADVSRPVLTTGSNQTSNPNDVSGWLGTYAGTCTMELTQDPTSGGAVCMTDGLMDVAFTTSIEFDTATGKLSMFQTVTWDIKNAALATFLPKAADREVLTIVNKTIAIDVPGVKPLCVSVDNTVSPALRFAFAVYQSSTGGKTYIEEGIFMSGNLTAGGQVQQIWGCPNSMSTISNEPICNSTTYNYRCKGVLTQSSSAPPSFPTPVPVPIILTPGQTPTPPMGPTGPTPNPPSTSAPPTTPPTPSTPNATTPSASSDSLSGGRGADQSSASSSSSSGSGSNVGIIAGVVGGAVGAILLIVAVLAFWLHKRLKPSAAAAAAAAPGTTGKGTAIKSAAVAAAGNKDSPPSVIIPTKSEDMAVVTVVAAPPAAIEGIYPGDPFLRTTAPQYSWTARGAGNSLYVQAGITDTYLDSMAVDGQAGPCVQMTSAQVRQEIELLTSGLLGRGGAALVFMCRWRKRFGNALLAIKVLKDAFDTPVAVLKSFQYEGQLLSAIRHQNVVQLYGWCMELPHVCLIMELLPSSLENLLYPNPTVNQRAATQMSLLNTSLFSVVDASHKPDSWAVTPGMTSHSNASASSAIGQSNILPVLNGPARASTSSITTPRTDVASPFSTPQNAEAAGSEATQTKKWSMQAVLRVAVDIASALAYLHGRQIPGLPDLCEGDMDDDMAMPSPMQPGSESRAAKVVHRDLKPANILLNSSGVAKLSDFGLARENASTTVHTVHANAGTLAYMAPELLALGASRPTSRVDIYSLGIMMWELVEQCKPWQDTNQARLVNAVLSGRRPPVPEWAFLRSSNSGSLLSPGQPKLAGRQAVSKDDNTPPDWSKVPAEFESCPEYLDLVRECWQQRETKRPTAAEVLRRLQCIMEQGQDTNNM